MIKVLLFCTGQCSEINQIESVVLSKEDEATLDWFATLTTAEILSGENARSFLAFKKKYPENMKKIVGAIWKLPSK